MHDRELGCPWPYPIHMYATPLSTLISSRSLNHHLYADDTQIFFYSFAPKTFITAISQLQHTISDISSWMTSIFLSLNQSKTEFMLIGLPQQNAVMAKGIKIQKLKLRNRGLKLKKIVLLRILCLIKKKYIMWCIYSLSTELQGSFLLFWMQNIAKLRSKCVVLFDINT